MLKNLGSPGKPWGALGPPARERSGPLGPPAREWSDRAGTRATIYMRPSFEPQMGSIRPNRASHEKIAARGSPAPHATFSDFTTEVPHEALRDIFRLSSWAPWGGTQGAFETKMDLDTGSRQWWAAVNRARTMRPETTRLRNSRDRRQRPSARKNKISGCRSMALIANSFFVVATPGSFPQPLTPLTSAMLQKVFTICFHLIKFGVSVGFGDY